MATKGAHFGWVAARSIYENPINRPVSHIGSLASYALKSTGGLLRRVAIGSAQMPALNDEIPQVSHAEPMDLVAFEKTLDKATGTRQDTGRIKFLVDGDEYFCRLMETINNAEESVDIRTYIFDNDDYAVAVADRLKERSEDVRVRIMLDSLGNMMAMQADSESMPTDFRAPLSIRMYMERESDLTTAANGREALDLFAKDLDQFDIVMTDQTMPGMTGEQLAAALLELKPGIPIILCSGRYSAAPAKDTEASGISASLQKPLTPGELRWAVRKALNEASV